MHARHISKDARQHHVWSSLSCLRKPRIAAYCVTSALPSGSLPLLCGMSPLPWQVYVREDNGIVYTTEKTLMVPTVSHNFGTHSAPWFLRGAIHSSKYYTQVSAPRHRLITHSQSIQLLFPTPVSSMLEIPQSSQVSGPHTQLNLHIFESVRSCH